MGFDARRCDVTVAASSTFDSTVLQPRRRGRLLLKADRRFYSWIFAGSSSGPTPTRPSGNAVDHADDFLILTEGHGKVKGKRATVDLGNYPSLP